MDNNYGPSKRVVLCKPWETRTIPSLCDILLRSMKPICTLSSRTSVHPCMTTCQAPIMEHHQFNIRILALFRPKLAPARPLLLKSRKVHQEQTCLQPALKETV
eukprot:6173247-Pleurochrysis_carterae.AAC.3